MKPLTQCIALTEQPLDYAPRPYFAPHRLAQVTRDWAACDTYLPENNLADPIEWLRARSRGAPVRRSILPALALNAVMWTVAGLIGFWLAVGHS